MTAPGVWVGPGTLGRMSDRLALRAARANGIPVASDASGHWASRLVRHKWTWVTVVATIIYALCLAWMYRTTTADIPVKGGTIPGLNWPAIRDSARLAAPTLAFWVVLYVWLDRYRPQRPLFWYLALGWGASVSTAASMVINTWAAQEMSITGNGDPSQGARAAVFVAPFVEEATKASILFFIAIAVRYQVVSKLTGVVLGGLSAAGFAYTENILYFARVIVYSSVTIETGDPEAALRQIVWLRGVVTAFGHPLFTIMTAIGLVIGVRTHSKVVRVLAPLVGFLAAAGLHMLFNTVASIGGPMQAVAYFTVALPLVLTVAIYVGRQIFVEGTRHRQRLTDFVRTGWLTEADAHVFSRQRSRWRAVLVSLTYGWRTFLATIALQRSVTELVYLRDAQIRGTVDEAGDARARALLHRIVELRPVAIADPRTAKLQLPTLPSWLRLRRKQQPPASFPPPGRLTPPAPVGVGAPPVGSQAYSPVDPRWGPPKG